MNLPFRRPVLGSRSCAGCRLGANPSDRHCGGCGHALGQGGSVRPNPDGAMGAAPAEIASLEAMVSDWLGAQGLDRGSAWREMLPGAGHGGAVAVLKVGPDFARVAYVPGDPRMAAFAGRVRALGYYCAADGAGGLAFYPMPTDGPSACGRCGTRSRAGMTFCHECGAALPVAPHPSVLRACARCGRDARDHDRFCRHCGDPLAPLAPRAAPRLRANPGALGRFLRGAR